MITKEEFINLIENYQKWDSRLEEVSKVLNIPSLFDIDWVDYGATLFETTIDLLFESDGADDISWWLWSKCNNPDLKMWDSNDNEIPTDTVEDLWEIVKDYRK